jgi:hypothetical protein
MYEVESILECRMVEGQRMYYTKWKGYKEPTLEPESSFTPGCLAVLGFPLTPCKSNMGYTDSGSDAEQVSEDGSYDVERIEDCQMVEGREMFLTKFKGYQEVKWLEGTAFSPECSALLDDASKARKSIEMRARAR